jgi:hypothetical protein
MKDMQAKLSKLLDEANDCDLIGNLATDPRKRATFRRLAHEYRVMAAELRADIASRLTRSCRGRGGNSETLDLH